MVDSKIDLFLTSNARYFNTNDISVIRDRLAWIPDDRFDALLGLTSSFLDPANMFVSSIVMGGLGVDRFLAGEPGLGFLKLITGGGFLIWTISDWFSVLKRARDKNLELLLATMYT